MKISPQSIEAIRQRVAIEEIVSDYVLLKRRGRSHWALCPFHQEKTPSFSVSPERGIFKCFGCGKGGDAISFVQEIEHIGYAEALKYLAERYGLTLEYISSSPEEEAAERTQYEAKESLHILMGWAMKHYAARLLHHEEGKRRGLSYAAQRGFQTSVQKTYGIGYALDKWDDLLTAATKHGYKREQLEEAGLVMLDGKKCYDRFRGRLMFPIHNAMGKVIAFGGRALEEDTLKYINSPETLIYSKGAALYGIFQAKDAMRKQAHAYLVEGYTDVMALHQAGITNVLAALGTALGTEQVRLLHRYVREVTLLFDGDEAGISAALRGMDLLLEAGFKVQAIALPPGEDPESALRTQGPTVFAQELRKNSQSFIQFKASHLLAAAGKDPMRRADAMRKVMHSVAAVPDELSRTMLVRNCSQAFEVEEKQLSRVMHEQWLARQQASKPLAPKPSPLHRSNALEKQEAESLRLLICFGNEPIEGMPAADNQRLAHYFLQEIEDIAFTNPVYAQILRMFRDRLHEGEIVDTNYLMAHGNAAVRKVVADMTAQAYELSEHWQRYGVSALSEKDMLKDRTYLSIVRLKHRLVLSLLQEKTKEMKHAKDQEACMRQYSALKRIEMDLSRILGIVVPGSRMQDRI